MAETYGRKRGRARATSIRASRGKSKKKRGREKKLPARPSKSPKTVAPKRPSKRVVGKTSRRKKTSPKKVSPKKNIVKKKILKKLPKRPREKELKKRRKERARATQAAEKKRLEKNRRERERRKKRREEEAHAAELAEKRRRAKARKARERRREEKKRLEEEAQKKKEGRITAQVEETRERGRQELLENFRRLRREAFRRGLVRIPDQLGHVRIVDLETKEGLQISETIGLELTEENVEEIAHRSERTAMRLEPVEGMWLCYWELTALGSRLLGYGRATMTGGGSFHGVDLQTHAVISTGPSNTPEGMLEKIRPELEAAVDEAGADVVAFVENVTIQVFRLRTREEQVRWVREKKRKSRKRRRGQ